MFQINGMNYNEIIFITLKLYKVGPVSTKDICDKIGKDRRCEWLSEKRGNKQF
jgi:hypothetical protein